MHSECHYTERHILNVIMLIVIIQSVILMTAIIQSVILMNAIILSDIIFSAIMPSVFVLIVIMLSVVAPFRANPWCNRSTRRQILLWVTGILRS